METERKMVEEFCKNIYNIGLDLRCGLSRQNCLCPDKASYEYLCYQCYLILQDKSKEDYQLKFNSISGEISICHDFKLEVMCVSNNWVGYQIINIIVNNAQKSIGQYSELSDKNKSSAVELVALALTQSAIFEIKDISYVNMIDAFKTDQFINHFWNLSMALMQSFKNGKKSEILLAELNSCISNLKIVFEKRVKIGEQFLAYLQLICSKLENTNCSIRMIQTFRIQQREFINRKKNANSFTEFIFYNIDTDGKTENYDRQEINDFANICFTIKEYLLNYQMQKKEFNTDVYENLISSLALFVTNNNDVHLIKGLEKIDFYSTNAWKANASIIMNYLQTVRRRNFILAYDLLPA